MAEGPDGGGAVADGPGGAGGAAFVEPVSGVRIPLGEIEWRFSTAGGPGGQHANTSNTRAEALFDVAASPSLPEWARQRLLERRGPVITASAGDTRSQFRNRDLAIERLSRRLAAALEERMPRRPTRPPAASQRRRLDQKRRRGRLKAERRGKVEEA